MRNRTTHTKAFAIFSVILAICAKNNTDYNENHKRCFYVENEWLYQTNRMERERERKRQKNRSNSSLVQWAVPHVIIIDIHASICRCINLVLVIIYTTICRKETPRVPQTIITTSNGCWMLFVVYYAFSIPEHTKWKIRITAINIDKGESQNIVCIGEREREKNEQNNIFNRID